MERPALSNSGGGLKAQQQENASQEQAGDAGPKDRINKGRALIGTQGWTGPDWRRLAYPNGLSASGRLSWYARVFDAVEVNSTFYGIPSHATVRTWRGSVPRGFTFTVNMPRLITHEPDLMRSDTELASFLSAVNELGESLGGVLVQLPPRFGPERLQELSQWMSRLPASEFRFFLESRSLALHGSRLSESLENAGVGQVTTNLNARPGEIAISPSVRAGYIRWLGPRGDSIAPGRAGIASGRGSISPGGAGALMSKLSSATRRSGYLPSGLKPNAE